MASAIDEVIPGLENVPIAQSGISFVDGQAGRLEYRGIDVEELAEKSSFEETSFLLMFGRLPLRAELDQYCADLGRFRRLKYRNIDLIKCLPEHGHPMDALQAAVAAIGMFYPRRREMDDSARHEACLRIIAKMPTVVAAFDRLRKGDDHILPRTDLSGAANFLYMLNGQEPDPDRARILEICLILHADHSMNASTFAGRVVGSTLADPYCVVSSALGALSGPLHGGANEDAMELFTLIGHPKRAREVLDKLIGEKRKIPGFGHRVYKTLDPRAKVLRKYAEELTKKSGSQLYEVAQEVRTVMAERVGDKGIWPNVDFYAGIVYSEIGVPSDCYTPCFAMARAAGWLAHWREQLVNNRIFRPEQKYVGQRGVPYTPIELRF